MSETVKSTVDPLLKDLDEKKESFRRHVAFLAAELKQVRGRLISQEHCFVKETLCRKEAESKVKKMEMEICKLQKKLEDRNCELEASTSAAEKFLEEVDCLRTQLSATKQTAETSVASSESVKLQCSILTDQLDEKTQTLKEHENRVNQLSFQLDDLQRDLKTRECSQKELREEVMRIECEITKAGLGTNNEIMKLLQETSPKNFERMNKLLAVKDEEIGKLKDEIRLMSAHWKLKTKEIESQLEKQRRVDQEVKKKVLKLEFCLHEARSQTRKLQRMGEKRDKAIEELRDEMCGKQWSHDESVEEEKHKFWDTSGFKIVVSMSMLILVIVSKR